MGRTPVRAYGRFAQYYDFIYHSLVDYEGDVDFAERIFRRFMGRRVESVLDLGCGTGNHAIPFARLGYDVTGLDLSTQMLAYARRKARAARLSIPFVHGDMRSFNLRRTFDAAMCAFGAFGYLLTDPDVLRCLRSVRRHLVRDGLFTFEFWQRSGVMPPPYQSWFHEAGSDYEVVRLSESRFDRRTGRLPIEFRFFVFKGTRLLDRFDEVHTVRTHAIGEMRGLLRRAGFDFLQAFEVTPKEKRFRPIRKETFRVMVVARPRALS